MQPADLKEKLLAFTAQRYQVQSDKDLNDYIFSNYLFHSYEPALIEFVFEHREEIQTFYSNRSQLLDFMDFCIRSTKQYTYKRNQYINYPYEYENLLRAEYRDFFIQIINLLKIAGSADDIAQVLGPILQHHHERLRLILATYCLSYRGESLERNALLQTVPCEEYSALLQLQILDIKLRQLKEPVLDIGCGSNGTLVRYLRDEGIAAFGMDRLAPVEPGFFQKDWFDFHPDQHWWTIIAHQSISTHFIYNHMHNAQMAKQYARLFMQILSSLNEGGEFFYAPGLPFFENEIAQIGQFSISKTPIAVNAFEIGEIAYATRILRIKK